MPVQPRVINGRIRTVAAGTKRIEKTDKGNARDGGGWPDTPKGRSSAARQSGYINASLAKKKKR